MRLASPATRARRSSDGTAKRNFALQLKIALLRHNFKQISWFLLIFKGPKVKADELLMLMYSRLPEMNTIPCIICVVVPPLPDPVFSIGACPSIRVANR